jgi:UDP:flavonoid glycosyltransferase YjiC (YdhE family)
LRVLLTSGPVYSHLVPMMLPIASALQSSGHEVAVATSATLADELHRCRLRHLLLPRMLAPSQMASDPDYARQVGLSEEGVPLPELGTMERGAAFGRLFAGLTATRAAEDMLAVASAFRPNLVVRECTELGGYLFAERLDLPCITLDIAPLVPSRHQGMLPWLNESRTTLKLPPVDDTSGLNGCGWVSWLPEPWYPDNLRSRALRCYRGDCGSAQQLDPVIAALPADRPFVLATLGSNTWATPRESLPFRQIVEALGALPCTAVVALGQDADPAAWTGPRPDNVHLVSFVQQRLLLPACDLFVTHAGFGGIREALSAGVPMVAIPLGAEQPANARRMSELGLGIGLRLENADTATVTAVCRHLLDDPVYRRAARGFQRRILGLPGVDLLVADLGKLTDSHRLHRAKRH